MVIAVAVGLALAAVAGPCIADEGWRTPPPGSDERRRALDALRTRLRGHVDLPLRFVVRELCLSPVRGWVDVEPRSVDGATRLEGVQATLVRVPGGRWRVEALACGEEECPPGTDPEALRARVAPACAPAPRD